MWKITPKSHLRSKRINRIMGLSGRIAFGYILIFVFLLNGFLSLASGEPAKETAKAIRTCQVTIALDNLMNLNLFPDTLTPNQAQAEPVFSDLVYEYKIAAIDNLSPISFDFNQHVKRYIEIFTLERREQVSQMLGLAELYFPLFDEMLDKHKLPLELKYLAVVESALNPLAESPTGAVGLWQFKINTARMFDLQVNSYVDERMDPVKSTEAACIYLNYLYKIFNDWQLVMAAYNSGPGVVRNAIVRSGGETNFWKLYDQLPEAAQNYVSAFIAAAYVMQNAKDHKIDAVAPVVTYFQTDTIHLSKPANFTVISHQIGVPVDVLRFLNPIYRRSFVPKEQPKAAIRIPVEKVDQFLKQEEIIYEKSLEKNDYHDVLSNAGNSTGKVMYVHKVQPGDYLHKIAIKYSCTVDDINVWNPELGTELSVGQNITIWIDNQTYSKLQKESSGALVN